MNAPVSNTLGAISTSDLQKWIGLSCFQMMIDLEFHADQHKFCKLGRIVKHKVVFGNENCFSNLKAMEKNEGNLIMNYPEKITSRKYFNIQNWIETEYQHKYRIEFENRIWQEK